jgi:hypothetical protein
MYSIIRREGVKTFAIQQSVPFVVSFLIAEAFYKFHSFTLECIAFLATWYVLDWVVAKLTRR